MSPVLLMAIGLAILALGYFVYSKYLANRVYQLNDSFRTPAHELRDGVDYVPTNKFVLWGHHFTSSRRRRPHRGPSRRPHLGLGPRIPLGDDRHGLLRRDARLRRPVGLRAEQGTVHRLAVRPLHRQARSGTVPHRHLHPPPHGDRRVLRGHHQPPHLHPLRGHPDLGRDRRRTAGRRGGVPPAHAAAARHHRGRRRPLCAHRAGRRGPRRHPGELPRHDADGLLDPHPLHLRRVRVAAAGVGAPPAA